MPFMTFDLPVVVVYRSPSKQVTSHFCNLLSFVFQIHEYVLIVGDFNADSVPTTLRQIMAVKPVQQMVSQPTHVKMGILDHVSTKIQT